MEHGFVERWTDLFKAKQCEVEEPGFAPMSAWLWKPILIASHHLWPVSKFRCPDKPAAPWKCWQQVKNKKGQCLGNPSVSHFVQGPGYRETLLHCWKMIGQVQWCSSMDVPPWRWKAVADPGEWASGRNSCGSPDASHCTGTWWPRGTRFSEFPRQVGALDFYVISSNFFKVACGLLKIYFKVSAKEYA